MISRMTGNLIELRAESQTIVLEVGQIGYDIMVPAYAISDLSGQMNHTITLYCLEYYEGTGGGNSFVPLLIGFPQPADKAFFQKFISVKGIGIRKALRALAQPLADIAYSIEEGNTRMLQSLPEIGKRTAEQVVAELKGKMADFALAGSGRAHKATKPLTSIEKEALEILLQLGERRHEAEDLIERATRSFEDIHTTDALIQAVYRLKTGIV